MAGTIKEVTDADFETEVLQSDTPVLVDFWAPWCGPCRMLTPVVEKVAASLGGALKVVKVNVDDNIETASNYGVRQIPTLLWFKGGQMADQWVGFLEEDALTTKSKAVIG